MKMMTEWKEYKLAEITEPQKGVYIPNEESDLKYIGLEHIEQETLRLNSIGKSSDITSNKFRFLKDDILFGKLRPYFRKVVKPQFDGICSTDIWVFRAKEGFHQNFLFYFLANWDFVDTANNGEGGTRMPRADWNYLKETKWNIPLLPEQKEIASVLSCLDDKIDLFHRQNRTLEGMAETLFRQWFVKEVEGNWRTYKLKELVKHIKPGTNYQPKRVNSGIPFLNVRNLKDGFLNYSDVSFISFDEYKRVHKIWVPEENDLLISRIGTLGTVAVISKRDLPVAVHYNMINIKPKHLSFQFLYFLLKSKKFQEIYFSNIRQSVQEYVAINDVENIEISLPIENKDFLIKENVFIILFNKINLNTNQIKTLTRIRDTLLPKLMSGEVRVKI